MVLQIVYLILQKHDGFLSDHCRVFFLKYNDMTYVKLSKLKILSQLATPVTVFPILQELKEYLPNSIRYTNEVDIDVVRLSVEVIGSLGVRISECADYAVEALIEFVGSGIPYLRHSAVIALQKILRVYPTRFTTLLSPIVASYDTLTEPAARASVVWAVGVYCTRISNAGDILGLVMDGWDEEVSCVKLSLLSSVVRVFLERPSVGEALVPRVLKLATEDDEPDLRDRGYIYWRLLTTDAIAAKVIFWFDGRRSCVE